MGFQCLCLLHNLGIRVHTNLLLHDIVTESKGKLRGALFVDAATLAEEGTEPSKKQSVRGQHFCPENRSPYAGSLDVPSRICFNEYSCLLVMQPNVQCGAPGTPLPGHRIPEDTQQALRAAYQGILDTWNLPGDGHGLARAHSLTSLRSFEPLEESTAMASTGLGAPSNSPMTNGPKLLPCRLLLTADRQNIDWDLLQAIQEAGLVYDGRMIVHHDFSTSDASIYAAGSLAEFHRRHRPTRATDLRHETYCPEEALCVHWMFSQEILRASYGREAAGGSLTQLSEGATDEVRTDTLRINWERPELSGVKERRPWGNLVSAEGQVATRDVLQDLAPCSCLGCSNFLEFIRKQAATLKGHPEIHCAIHSRVQSLKACSREHARTGLSPDIHSCEEETNVESLCAVPVGASCSKQREKLQLQVDIADAENTLHPLLVHDVQRQLIEYLRQMQQKQDGNDLLHNYYIPSYATVEAGSKSRLERQAK
ncbi:hypothetical protein Emed_005671 [Eimeria media]